MKVNAENEVKNYVGKLSETTWGQFYESMEKWKEKYVRGI